MLFSATLNVIRMAYLCYARPNLIYIYVKRHIVGQLPSSVVMPDSTAEAGVVGEVIVVVGKEESIIGLAVKTGEDLASEAT